ncbi:MAG: hypothetical protein ACI9I0_001141 [Rhodoferax sp.]|jgi:hypothetical protein
MTVEQFLDDQFCNAPGCVWMAWVAYGLDLSCQAKTGKLDEDVIATDFESFTYAMARWTVSSAVPTMPTPPARSRRQRDKLLLFLKVTTFWSPPHWEFHL